MSDNEDRDFEAYALCESLHEADEKLALWSRLDSKQRAAIKAQAKELREEGAVASNELSKLKGADWASRRSYWAVSNWRDSRLRRAFSRRSFRFSRRK